LLGGGAGRTGYFPAAAADHPVPAAGVRLLRARLDAHAQLLRGKIWILIFMWTSMSYSIWRLHDRLVLQLVVVAIGTGVTIYLTRFVPTMRIEK
jgi:uncharacterized membrane protein YbaN (DUF454 family)